MKSPTAIEIDFTEVVSQYAFYHGTIDRFQLIPQKLSNQNAWFEIDNRRWVIKFYRTGIISNKLKLSHQLQLQLIESGFPVAKLETSTDGQTLIKTANGYYSIHRWVEGRHIHSPSINSTAPTDVIREVASMLGRFHQLGAEEAHSGELATLDKAFSAPAELARTQDRRRDLKPSRIFRLRIKPIKTSFDRWILQHFEQLCQQASQLAEQLHKLPSFREFIAIHNDINWDNLIFNDDNKLAAIIDFDNLMPFSRQYEIGAATLVIAGTDNEAVTHFLNSYRQASGLNVDNAAVMIAMRHKCVRSIIWSIHSYLGGNIEDRAALQSWCKYLHYCLGRMDHLSEQLQPMP
ncbi:MAG: phosphotransferase [Gammaproteobacteria bacterium]|nr:phosphotransferase [Gammaproteobacteria bacterium]